VDALATKLDYLRYECFKMRLIKSPGTGGGGVLG